MEATTRSERGSHKTRLGLAIASAMTMAFSLSGIALATELPHPTNAPSSPLSAPAASGRSSRTPPASVSELALRSAARRSQRKRKPKPTKQPRSDRYTLPVARRLIARSELDRPHHDYPAWDLPVPVGTRVVAVRAGRVQEITDSGSCGNGVVVRSSDDYTYTYCHGSEVRVRRGSRVRSGQLVMLSGSSGHSTGPHLHLQIESPSGRLLCPQSLVTSWFNGGQLGPETATSTGCFYATQRHSRHRRSHHHAKERQGGSDGSLSSGGSGSGASQPTGSGPSKPSPKPKPSPSSSPTPKPTTSPTPLPLPSPSLT